MLKCIEVKITVRETYFHKNICNAGLETSLTAASTTPETAAGAIPNYLCKLLV